VEKDFGYKKENVKEIFFQYQENSNRLKAELQYYLFDFSTLHPNQYHQLYFEKLLEAKRQCAFKKIREDLINEPSAPGASDFLSFHLKQLDTFTKEATIKLITFQRNPNKTEKEIACESLYLSFKDTTTNIINDLLHYFSGSKKITLPKRSRFSKNCPSVFYQAYIKQKKVLLEKVKHLVTQQSLKELISAPIRTFLELVESSATIEEERRIEFFYELSGRLEEFLECNKLKKNLTEEIESTLIPFLVKSNFNPDLLLQLFMEYHLEQTEALSLNQKFNYWSRLQKRYNRQQLTANKFSPYQHFEDQMEALPLILRFLRQETEELVLNQEPNNLPQKQIIEEDLSEQKSQSFTPLPFNLNRQDLVALFVALRDNNFLSNKLKDGELARLLEGSLFYNTNEPMKSIKPLISLIKREEIQPSPKIEKIRDFLFSLFKKDPL